MTGCTLDKNHLGLSILSFHMWVMLSLFLCILIGCVGLEQPKKTNPLPPHHTPKGFQNLYRPSERGFGDFLRWRFGLGPKEISPIPPEEVSNYKPESVQPATSLIKQPDSAQVQITWIGHSTFLIQIEGTNILTDPQFSDYCGPNSFLGINRVAPLGVPFDGLPPIHAVLISHNHYDHLDAPTVERLGNEPTYFVPLGIARWFEKRKIKNVVELDWWQTCPFHGLKVHSVPIQHFSNRTLFDRNETLWSGWVIESKLGKDLFRRRYRLFPYFQGNRTPLRPHSDLDHSHWCLQTSLVHEPGPCRSSRGDQDSKRYAFPNSNSRSLGNIQTLRRTSRRTTCLLEKSPTRRWY